MPAADERAAAVRALEGEFTELFNQVRSILARNAEQVSPGLQPGAYKVLTAIARCERVTVSFLAERMMTDKGQVSRLVRELEGLGLVERSPDPADRRSALLSLTAFGQERLAAARLPHEDLLTRALAEWSVAEIDSLRHLMHALVNGVRPVP